MNIYIYILVFVVVLAITFLAFFYMVRASDLSGKVHLASISPMFEADKFRKPLNKSMQKCAIPLFISLGIILWYWSFRPESLFTYLFWGMTILSSVLVSLVMFIAIGQLLLAKGFETPEPEDLCDDSQ